MISELSRLVRIDTLGEGPRSIEIVADEVERAALARRFGLLALDRLAGTAELTCEGETVIAVGRIAGAVSQACVASGEPVAARIDESYALRFVPEGTAAGDEIELGETDLDELVYSGGSVDVGEAIAQTLALALDPFPRSPQADVALRAAGVKGEEEAGPFGALASLRDKLGK